MHELTAALAQIMAGVINGGIKADEGRIALNAATRIIEVVQAETRLRALAFATRTAMPAAIPLDRPIWPTSDHEQLAIDEE
jgi:hypothetical protein